MVRTWADAVSPVLQSVPAVPIPFADQLPKPEDVVTGAYEFAEKLLASQRQFSEELLKAAAPLVPATSSGKPRPPSRHGPTRATRQRRTTVLSRTILCD